MARNRWGEEEEWDEPELYSATPEGTGSLLFTDRTDRMVQTYAHIVGAILLTVLASHFIQSGLLPFVPLMYFIIAAYVYSWLDNRALRKELDSLTA
jgi:hypothetical protein